MPNWQYFSVHIFLFSKNYLKTKNSKNIRDSLSIWTVGWGRKKEKGKIEIHESLFFNC